MSNAAYPTSLRRFAALVLVAMLFGMVPAATPLRAKTAVRALQRATLPPSQPFAPAHVAQQRSQGTVYLPLAMQAPAMSEARIVPGIGGTLRSPDQRVSVTFSAKAVTQPVQVRYTASARPLVSTPGLAVGGAAFTLSGHSVSSDTAITQFPHEVQIIAGNTTRPVTSIVTPSITISVAYSDAEVWGLDTRTLSLYEQTNTGWQRISTAVDSTQRKLTAVVDTTGTFAPMARLAVAAPSAPNKRLALDPDDNDASVVTPDPNPGPQTEYAFNLRLARETKQRLEADKCRVDIILTRDADNVPFVPDSIRANVAQNFNADLFTTFAFNSYRSPSGSVGPWGVEHDGGVRGWARSGHPNDDALVQAFLTEIATATTRPSTSGVQHPSLYPTFEALPDSMTYAHIEALFLNHNFDWPIIANRFDWITNGTYNALRKHLEAMGMVCGDDPNNPPPYPAPPSEAERKRMRDLGFQNYQKYGADPVSFSTGNHVLSVPLVRLPGRGGLDFDLTLVYNAQDGRDDLFGYGWSFPYNARAQVYSDGSVSVVLHDGRTYTFTPNGSGGYNAEAGVYERLEETQDGWQLVAPDETTWSFKETVGGLGVLAALRDRQGNTLTFDYDLSGQNAWESGNVVPRPPLTAMHDSAGRTIAVQQNGDNITTITLPDGRAWTFGYTNGDLTSITDANGGTRQYAYDERHRLTHETDPEGIHFLENMYDDRDRVVEQIDASGTHDYLSYDPLGRVTTFTDNGGNTYRYRYDDLNRVTSAVDPLNHTDATVYNPNYDMTSRTDARGNQTSYTYDVRGNMLTRTDPVDAFSATYYSSDTTTWTYNARNLPTTMTNALGQTWQYDYDSAGNLIKTTAPDGSTTTATYNAQGEPISLTDENGHTTSYEYDATGNLIKTTDAAGRSTTSTYDAGGRETGYTDANGHTVVFTPDANSNVTQITDPKGKISTFVYDRNDLLKQTTDRVGGVRAYAYDENLKLTGERDAANHWTHYAYDQLYRRVTTTDARGNRTHYTYDRAGHIASVTDASGATTLYGYDASSNLQSVADPLGHITTMIYDAMDRIKYITDATGARTEFCYDAEDRLVRTIGPRGEVTDYTFNAVGRLVATKDALGNSARHEYDPAGNQTATIDPLGRRTETAYDVLDRVISVARPPLPGNLRPTTQFAYDAVGNTTVITNPNGFATRLAYDANDNLQLVTDAQNEQTHTSYDAEDRPTSVADAKGHTWTTTYNLVGLPIETRDALDQRTQMEYDDTNNLAKTINALGKATTYTYDALDRMTSTTDPLGNTTSYSHDAAGRLRAQVDAEGHRTQYAYDAVNRLLSVTDALSGTTSYSYDKAGNLARITDAKGATTRFDYTFLDQLAQETDALSHTWHYAYDGAGNMIRRVDAQWRATTYEYDSNHRLAATRYTGNDAPPITYTYDLDGNQTAACNQLGCIRNRYDALDRQTATTDWAGATITRTFDAAGNLDSLTYPNGGKVGYGYDANNRLASLTDPRGGTISYDRDLLGMVTRINRPNATVSTFSYDDAQRLVGIDNRKAGAAQPQSAYAYALDRVGNRTEVKETRAAFNGSNGLVTLTHRYGYDALDRLVSAQISEISASTDYTFDPVGNRVGKVGSVPTPNAGTPALPVAPRPHNAAATYNAANQLLAMGDSAFDYNANGDRTSKTRVLANGATETSSYRYDREDRLLGVTTTISNAVSIKQTLDASYTYDAYGRRATKLVRYPTTITPTEVLTYTYDGLDIIGTQLQRSSIVTTTQFYLASSPITGLRRAVAMERLSNANTGFAGDRYWYQTDGLDSVVALTDANGTIASALLYDEYGQRLAGKGDLALFTFTAQDEDAETGLIHFYARYYDPATGTWLTQDAYRGQIVEPRTLHRYGYVGGRIINYVDFWGFASNSSCIQKYVNDSNRDYNRFDDVIDAKVTYWNEEFSSSNNKLNTQRPAELTKLDPNLVKAMLMQESSLGYNVGNSGGIFQITETDAISSLKNYGYDVSSDWSNTNLNIEAGILWLYYKQITDYPYRRKNYPTQGESEKWYDNSNPWKRGVRGYNGWGKQGIGYVESVFNLYENGLRQGKRYWYEKIDYSRCCSNKAITVTPTITSSPPKITNTNPISTPQIPDAVVGPGEPGYRDPFSNFA